MAQARRAANGRETLSGRRELPAKSARCASVALLAALAGLFSACLSDSPRSSPSRTKVSPASAARPNVLLITVDSLRADALDWSLDGATPALAAMAAAGTRFDRAYTVTPWTAPALVSIFTGLYPPTHGVANRDDTTPRTLLTLPRLLARRGYTLANFGFFTSVSYYRNLGLPPQAVVGAEINGTEALAAWLAAPPEPFFAWIHNVEPHLPYGAGGYEAAEARIKGSSALERSQVSATVPRRAGLSFAAGDDAIVKKLYAQDVARLDRAVARVLEAVDRTALSSRTLVLFTADHGEELLEHGWVGHASTSGEAKLHEEILHIPLLIRGPGVPRGKASGALAQNVDVAPTLLELAGFERPRAMQGISLVPALAGSANSRTRVFFDTSPGGHLTPDSRRGERLQGVGDGLRIHTERLGGLAQADDPVSPALAPDLARFRKQQARARLRFLTAHGQAERPPAAAVAAFSESLPLGVPAESERLTYDAAGGTIRLSWTGDTRGDRESYWVEYAVGAGLLSARGAFPVEEPGIAFGPFPIAFWNDLAGYSPFRYRILDPAGKSRSAWRTFSLERSGVPKAAAR
ncbi:MAG: sulfatase [Thermoanaerobaculia bacterium]